MCLKQLLQVIDDNEIRDNIDEDKFMSSEGYLDLDQLKERVIKLRYDL